MTTKSSLHVIKHYQADLPATIPATIKAQIRFARNDLIYCDLMFGNASLRSRRPAPWLSTAARSNMRTEIEFLQFIQECVSRSARCVSRALRSDLLGALHGIIRLPRDGVDTDDTSVNTSANPLRAFRRGPSIPDMYWKTYV